MKTPIFADLEERELPDFLKARGQKNKITNLNMTSI
jgi:hypothetical protein